MCSSTARSVLYTATNIERAEPRACMGLTGLGSADSGDIHVYVSNSLLLRELLVFGKWRHVEDRGDDDFVRLAAA